MHHRSSTKIPELPFRVAKKWKENFLPNISSMKHAGWEYLSARRVGCLYVITVSQIFVNDQLLILNATERPVQYFVLHAYRYR